MAETEANRRLSQFEALWRSFLPSSAPTTPPGPPVILGAVLAIWLFARANTAELMLALLVAVAVSLVLTRARRDADQAAREAAHLRSRFADIEFALRSSSRVTWAVDFDRRELRLGDHVEELLGFRPSFEDCAKAAPSFIHSEDRAAVTKLHADALEAGEAGPAQIRLVRPDGEVRWVRYSLQARRDGARLETLFAVATDFTDIQKRGRAVLELMANAERHLAAGRPELEALLADIGVDIPMNALEPEAPLATHGNGEQFAQASARFARIVQEFAARRIAFHQAVTALKAARLKSDTFAQIADLSTDALMIFGADGLVEWVNPAFEQMTGWSLEEVKGQDVRKRLVGPDTNLSVLQNLSAQMNAYGEGGCELLLYRRDGEAYWADIRGGRMHPVPGTAKRTFLIKRDLTERKFIEAELESALVEARAGNAAKSEFLANMSHELRTPLNAVIGYSEMLQEEFGDTPAGQDAGRIRESGRHLLSVINTIIDLARADAQHIDVLAIDSDRPHRDAALRTITRLGFVCAGVDDADAAVAHAEEQPALLVINCGAGQGWDALQTAVSAFAQTPILALTPPGEGARAMSMGAAAHLDAPASAIALAAAVARYARKRDETRPEAKPSQIGLRNAG